MRTFLFVFMQSICIVLMKWIVKDSKRTQWWIILTEIWENIQWFIISNKWWMIYAKWVLFLDNSFRQLFYSKYVYEFLCSIRFVFYCLNLKNDETKNKGYSSVSHPKLKNLIFYNKGQGWTRYQIGLSPLFQSHQAQLYIERKLLLMWQFWHQNC